MTTRGRSSMAQTIEHRILEGVLNPGEPLPSERDLAVEFDLSRASVREVLREMSEAGLVDIQPGRGTFVTRPTQQQPAAGILRWARRAGVTPRNVVDARIALESETAANAAVRARSEEVDFLRTLLIRLDNEIDPLLASQLDIAFHLGIARVGGNPVSEMLLTTLAPLTADLVESTMRNVDVVAQRAEQHRAILDAIAAGDQEQARSAMVAHLGTGSRVLPHFDQPLVLTGTLPAASSLETILERTVSGAWPRLGNGNERQQA